MTRFEPLTAVIAPASFAAPRRNVHGSLSRARRCVGCDASGPRRQRFGWQHLFDGN
jgi:hypothetical protein